MKILYILLGTALAAAAPAVEERDPAAVTQKKDRRQLKKKDVKQTFFGGPEVDLEDPNDVTEPKLYCDSSCASCNWLSSDDCLTCPPGKDLTVLWSGGEGFCGEGPDGPHECYAAEYPWKKWKLGKEVLPKYSKIDGCQCHPTCATCGGDDRVGWTSYSKYRHDDEQNLLELENGYYRWVIGSTDCLSCHEGFELYTLDFTALNDPMGACVKKDDKKDDDDDDDDDKDDKDDDDDKKDDKDDDDDR